MGIGEALDMYDEIEANKNRPRARILKGEPIVAPLAEMTLLASGIREMMNWVNEVAPECVPEEYAHDGSGFQSLFPHDLEDDDRRALSGNELLVELAGRKCYNSFGAKAGRKSNREYIANTQAGDIPHASIMYHAKISFFIAGVSRRVSHELIRHYVGADRDEEGSPSQESTRYVEHAGRYIAPPRILADEDELGWFQRDMDRNYQDYRAYIAREFDKHKRVAGAEPKGIDRKRVYEAASARLSHTCETSWIWTTNPIALAKLLRERDNEAADLEFSRLAKKWKRVAVERWPNLFPMPWMRVVEQLPTKAGTVCIVCKQPSEMGAFCSDACVMRHYAAAHD